MDSIYKILESMEQVEEKFDMTPTPKSERGKYKGKTAVEETGRMSIGQQMARDGITYSRDRERELISQIADYMEKNGYTKRQISYYLSYDEDFIPDVLGELPREGIMEDDYDGASVEDIASAITSRMMSMPNFGKIVREIDIIDLNDAIEDVAQFHQGGDLGTSDVSIMVKEVLKQLGVEHMNEAEVGEGNEFSGELAKARAAGAKEFKVDGKTYKVEEAAKPDFLDLDKDGDTKEPMKKAAKDKEMKEDYDRDEYDEEGEMAKSQARTIEDAARELQEILDDDENLPEWVQKKITLAMDYIDTARDYMKANPDEEEMDVELDEDQIDEKAVSEISSDLAKRYTKNAKVDRDITDHILKRDGSTNDWKANQELQKRNSKRTKGINRAAKRVDAPKSDLEGASKAMMKMSTKELEKYAGTKHKGLPKKKTESTTSGSVAASTGATGEGIYGNPSIYEGFNSRVENMITEGMQVNVSSGTEDEPSVNVNATGADAYALAQLLKLAAVPARTAPCEVCGGMHEGSCMREENEANSADNTQTYDMQYLLNAISGGLNGPKRQINPNNAGDNPLAMTGLGKNTLNLEESDSVESHLKKLYQEFKGK
jgi:hypothetical protein